MSTLEEKFQKYNQNTSNNNLTLEQKFNKYNNSTDSLDNAKKEKKSLIKTASAGAQYLGQSILNGFETTILDPIGQLAAATNKLLGKDDEANAWMDLSNISLTNMLINKVSGNETNPFINNNQNLWNKEVDKGSYIKENNLGGQIVKGVGEMLPTIAIGGSISGGQKAQKLASNIMLGSKAFSSGTNEAYQESNDIGKSMLYGLGSAGTELLTEKISGGIPGLKQINGTTKKEIAKNYLKSVAGEGVEEIASSLANPLLQTIYKGSESLKQYGDKDYWKEVLDSGVVGSITGGILDAPNTVNSLRYNRNITNNPNTGLETAKSSDSKNKYSYLPTNNQKINNLNQSASTYFNNSQETNNMINTISKVIKDKNYNILFDNTITNQNGKSVNAQIKTLDNGEIEIRLNPNSSRAGEFLLTHEITHAIETDSMKQLVIDYANKNVEFNQALESLKQTYGTDDVSSEVLADISGQLFGNQEFINNLSMEKPNVFKKIYNKIIELANKITGNSKESLFIRDLKNKWEDAYRTQNNNLNGNIFSIQTDMNGNKYVNVDTNQDIFEGKSLVEQTKIAKQYILDNFREHGINVNSENINVTSKTANEYTHPKNQLPTATKQSKMKASTELDNLLSISQYKSSNIDDGRHPFAKDGWDYYETVFKVGNNTFTGLINIGKNGNKKTLYDITNIKRIDQNRDTSANAFSTSLVNSVDSNIPQSNNNVKKGTLPKYSMQESQNNTQELGNSSFSLTNHNGKQLDISNIEETNYMKQHTFNRKYSRDTITTYRGVGEDGGTGIAFYGLGLYTTLDKNYARQYGKVNVVDNSLLPNNPLHFKTQNDFHVWEQELAKQLNVKKSELYGKDWGVEQYLNKLGYDGLMIGTGKDTDLISFTESAIKYSQNNDTWQEHLEKNYKSTGTRTDMTKFILPKASDIQIENKGKLPTAKKIVPQDPTKESSYDNNKKLTRQEVKLKLLNEMGINEEDISIGNDISSIDLARTDPIRVNEKIFGYEIGKKINDATINKTKHNEAERIRFLNKERSEIEALDIKPGSKESAAVQKYGEKQYVTKDNKIMRYGDYELSMEFPDINTQNKIKNAAKVIRKKYDTYIDQINDSLINMGYNPIKKRSDYMRHFQALDDVFSKYGIPLNAESMQNDALPTDINGLTDQFKPGKNFFTNAMERIGLKTEYDAITGIDGYLEGASNLIYHTEDIQRYRTLSNLVRDTYGSKHGFDDFDSMSVEQQEQRVKDIQSNKLSKYAAWLDEQANSIAGKKGKIDRGTEELFGRKVYTILDTAKKQVGSNMTGFNVRSALTNFASSVQGASKTNKLAFIKGTISTVNNLIHKDGLSNKSDFLTNRFGSKQLSQKLWQKMSNAGQTFMEGSDYFTANQIWRSKYYENLSKGMNETQAIKNADDFSSRIMGDRSKGSTATLFNSKTLGFFTQFQLEVNNQWSSLIHDNKMDIQSGNKTGATVIFQLGQLAAMSYMFNNLMKSLTGSAVMLDPIDLLMKIFNPDDEDKSIEKRTTEVLGEIVDNLPFASMFNGGRIPVGEAFTGGTTFFKKMTNQTDKYGNNYKWSDVGKDTIESAFYWLLPTGYGQAKKTIKGASMYSGKLPTTGSYTDSGNLRFTADKSASGITKAFLFGQYSSKEAQDYVDSGYKTISKNNVQEMKDLGMTSTEYRNYRQGLSNAGKTNDEKLDYINKLDVSIEQKNIMANNVVNSDKYTIDMKEYSKYSSYDEMKYSIQNPAKYSLINQITTYDKYSKYKNELEIIRDNSSDKKSDTIKYINSLKLSIPQKAMFIKMYYSSFNSYDDSIIKYINEQRLSSKEKSDLLNELGFKAYTSNGKTYVRKG